MVIEGPEIMGKTNNGETGGTVAAPAAGPRGLEAASARGPAPVHLWNPPHCGDSLMRIARDGTWFHEGTPIGRPGMVRLFASILRRDPEGFVLVTPVEKVSIEVEDAPFVAVDVDGSDDALTFTTNLGDEVIAGPDHPIRVEPGEEPRPYVLVRGGLEALIDRKTFYRLVDLGETVVHDGAEWFGVRSQRAFFPIILAAEMPT